MDIFTVRDIVRARGIIPTVHARTEMTHDGLIEEEVKEVILSGELVSEEYDEQGVKYVVEGETWLLQRRLRIITAVRPDESGEDAVVVVTVYALRGRRERRERKR
jgi:hypothetical protein